MGPSATAEPLEEVTLPQGGERSPADSANVGEGHSISIQTIPQVNTKTREVGVVYILSRILCVVLNLSVSPSEKNLEPV